MSDAVRERALVENPNLWHSVEVVRDWPDLDALGAAGARMKLDALLSKPEGMTPEDQAALREVDIEVLRSMATKADPALGVTHQARAIGALAEQGDSGAVLVLAERARDASEDDRVRIAAINALGVMDVPGVDRVVRDLIKAKQPSIRAQAIRALGRVGSLPDIGMLEQVGRQGDDGVGLEARRAVGILRARLASNE